MLCYSRWISLRSRSNRTDRQHNMHSENTSNGSQFTNLIKDPSNLLLIWKKHCALLNQATIRFCPCNIKTNSIYIPSFELIILHELCSFVCHNILLRFLTVELNTQRGRCILLAFLNETSY